MNAALPVSNLRPPLPSSFVKADAFDTTGDIRNEGAAHVFLILFSCNQSQITNTVVLTIAVDVVNFLTVRNWTVDMFPDSSVQHDFSAIHP